MMAPVLEEVKTELGDRMTVEEINVDEKPDVAQQYGVLSIPTYIVVKDDKEVDRIIGFTQRAAFVDQLKKHLS